MELQPGQYMGATPLRRTLPGLVVAESQHGPHTRIPLHRHVNPHFTFVLAGAYTEHCQGAAHQYRAGDLIFHPAQAEHSNTFARPAVACFNVEVGPECHASLSGTLQRVGRYALLPHPRLKGLLAAMVQELKDPDSFSDVVLFGHALELTGLFLRGQQGPGPEPAHVRRVKAFLEEVPQATPALAELSRVAEVSAEYLCREFRRVLGVSPGEYLRRRKVEQACELLADQPRLTTEEVAFRVGFADASHLNKVFHKVLGVSPTAYRRELR